MIALKFNLLLRATHSEFIRKIAETFATRVSLIGMGMFTSVIVARILGPEGWGHYAVATAIGAFGVQFGNMGLHASNSYYVARDRRLLLPLLANTMYISLFLGGGIAMVAMAVFFFHPGLAPLHGRLLLLALIWVPFGLAYLLLQNLLIGMDEIRAYNKIEIANRMILIVLVFLLIAGSFVTVESVFTAGLISLLISLSWILWKLRVSISRILTPSIALFLENIRYGIKAYLAAFFAFLIQRVDLLMVKYILGATEAGYYSVALSMADMVYILPAVVGILIFPRLTAMESDQEKWNFSKKAAVYLGAVLTLIVATAILLAKPMIGVLYGKVFLQASPPFVILSVATIFYGMNNMFSYCLAAMSFPWFAVNIWVGAACLNVLLNLYMIRALGIIGAALSSLICYVLIMVLQYSYLAGKRLNFASTT